ncbi:hypothetical protein D3C78_1499070 [compost metagenome]
MLEQVTDQTLAGLYTQVLERPGEHDEQVPSIVGCHGNQARHVGCLAGLYMPDHQPFNSHAIFCGLPKVLQDTHRRSLNIIYRGFLPALRD